MWGYAGEMVSGSDEESDNGVHYIHVHYIQHSMKGMNSSLLTPAMGEIAG